jgi:adenosylcobinamide-phosphate synthase
LNRQIDRVPPPRGGKRIVGEIDGLPLRPAAMLVALALDLIGEPPAAIHPVVLYGRLIRRLERRAPRDAQTQLRYGGVILLLALAAAAIPARTVERSAVAIREREARKGKTLLGSIAYVLIVGAALKPFFALRMLADAGTGVRHALDAGDLGGAREALGSLVSRERDHLSAELVAAAAVESLAENLSDSVVAPLMAYALFGLPGAACYRLVNTMDAMIGYHGRYEHLGKFAARFDDACNLIPARLTAALIVALAPLYGGGPRTAWRIWRRDAHKTASPNAGHPMAAAAGALGVSLEKVGHYRLGDAQHSCTATTIRQAERMVWRVGLAAVVMLAGIGMARHGANKR